MANSVEWIFSLFDKVSAPAAKILKSMEDLDRKVKEVGDEAKKSEGAFESLFTTIDHGINVFEKFAKGAEYIGDIALGFAEAGIEAASFQETTKIALDTVLGDHAAAMGVLKQGKNLAALTPSTTEEILSAGTGFILAGFKPEELQNLEVAMNDIKALNPGRANFSSERFGQILAEIPGVGLDERHIKELARDTHLPMEGIFKNLASNFGMPVEEIKKNLKGLDSRGVIVSILNALREKEGGELGSLTYKFSQSLPGLMSTLKSRPMELLMDLDMSPGFARLKDFVSKVSAFLDPNSLTGKRVAGFAADLFNNFFSGVFGDMEGAGGMDILEKRLTGLLNVVVTVATMIEGTLEGAFEGLFGAADDLFTDGPMSPEKLKEIREESKRFGTDVASAFKEVLVVVKEVASAFGVINKGFATLNEINGIENKGGGGLFEGLSKKFWDDHIKAGDVVIPGSAGAGPTPLEKAQAGGVTGDVHITVHAPNASAPHEIASHVHQAVKSALTQAIEQVAMEHGNASRMPQ